MSNQRYNPVNREFDVRNWGFRRSYPTGAKLKGDMVAECTACHKSWGERGTKLPKTMPSGELEPCPNMIGEGRKQRCMNREYHMYETIEIEAMPIGRVRLPTKGKEW